MKVLHIIAGDLTGGAARGAYWLHCGLKEAGVNSSILTNSKTTLGDSTVVTTSTSKLNFFVSRVRRHADKFITIFYHKKDDRLFSSGFFGADFTKTQLFKEADIVHLHWINNNFVDIKHLSKIKKPIVWTIRDMWPLTGGCHYSMDCERYKIGCGRCKQLRSTHDYDLSKYIMYRKIKYIPKNTKIVGISNWISNRARESSIFSGFDIRMISNNINTNVFFPKDKNASRKSIGINTTKKIILCGATNLNDFYKGFDDFISSLKFLDKNKYYLCFFGIIDDSLANSLGFEYKNLGYLNDNVSLMLTYNSADVFVAPSKMEAFGKTIAESMACSTPVVCFDANGPKDIIDHKRNGYLAKAFSSQDLANGVEWIINSDKNLEICNNARSKVVREFSSDVISKKYIKLYKEIISSESS